MLIVPEMEEMESPVKNKICSKCDNSLEAIPGNFHRDKSKKDGLSSSCADCCRATKSKTYSEITSIRLKQERLCKRKAYMTSEIFIEKQKESKNKRLLRQKRYREKNRKSLNEKERIRFRKEITPEKKREYKSREYIKLKNCPYRKYVHYLRTRLNDISNKTRRGKLFSVSGTLLFSKEEFLNHIENLFSEGMSWENHGRNTWHIDHIRPLASFDLSNVEDLKEAFSLKNLQPLFSKMNSSKGSVYNGVRHRFA